MWNGKNKAITFSYDDGVTQDIRLVELFNKYGIKGSFHLNGGLLDEPSGRTVSAEEVATLYAGHEVSAHSLTHPFLERVSTAEVVSEMLEDRHVLEKACGYPVRGMSYPMGTYNDEVLKVLRTHDQGDAQAGSAEQLPGMAPHLPPQRRSAFRAFGKVQEQQIPDADALRLGAQL